jgi:Flp pilus assembly protein TadD
MLLARLYSERGLSDLALEHLRLASAQFPESAPVALALAKILREMGAPQEALKTVETSAKRQEPNWELLSLEGILEDEAGRLKDAESAYRKAVELEPARSSVHNNLGYNLLLQDQPKEAEAEFRKALEIDPHSQIAHNNLASALAATAQTGALAELERGSTNNAVAHNNMGALLIEQGKYPEARKEIQEALALRQNLPEAMANLKLTQIDGQPATLPIHKSRVNLWSHLTSGWDKLSGHKETRRAAQTPRPAGAPVTVGDSGEGK